MHSAGGTAARRYQLSHAIGPGAEEFEKAEIAEDLKLLANFVANMAISWIQLRETFSEPANII